MILPVACFIFLCIFISSKISTVFDALGSYPRSCKTLLPKILIFASILLVYYFSNIFTPRYEKSSNLKYILTWTVSSCFPIDILKTGQDAFIEKKCPVDNCYVTHDRGFFGREDSITMFDAIIFNGRNLRNITHRVHLPKQRLPNQIYIFNNMESAENHPVCNPIFDNFFNWTATYKLNSDVVYSYITIRDNNGEYIGPRIDMTWIDGMSKVNATFRNNLLTKTQAVAWFVTHCKTLGKREDYARNLKRELEKLGMALDIYGSCGDQHCPRSEKNVCDDMLKDDYYFYLSFENSIIEDYITEKVLTALLNNNVPIVFGGANYSRFLPPGSYINARKYTPKQLAATIANLIDNPEAYYEFFRWNNHYRYFLSGATTGSSNHVCKLCAALNNEEKLKRSQVYQDFRRWWHPDYPRRCRHILT